MRRSAAVFTALAWLATACSFGTQPGGVELARDPTLNLAISADIQTLDPATLSQPGVEVNLMRNVFGGLYRYENDLRIVADLADGPPEVTADGRTWTFRIRQGARFWNGDPVRAEDVVFSWSRAAARRNDSSVIFEDVVGFDTLQAGKGDLLEGLAAPDGRTVVAHLSKPAGWWLAELALWPAWVLDEKAVHALGDDTWWRTPEGLVGSGPFKLATRTPGALDFVPVSGWWHGSTGPLRHVHVQVVPDAEQQVRMFEAGQLDVVGYNAASTAPFLPTSVVQRYLGDRKLSPRVYRRPWLKSELLTFNLLSGPLAGASGLPGRRALSRAIDRNRVAREMCGGVNCVPASGGLIVRGLQGYLGDRADPNAVYDPPGARADLRAWDPDGSRASQLVLLAGTSFRELALEIAKQWKDTLGINVSVTIELPPATFAARLRGQFVILAGGFLADYDSPYDWYANSTFVQGTSYSNPSFQSLFDAASRRLPDSAAADFTRAGKLLLEDVAYTELDYLQWSYLVSPHVIGAGGNALYDYYWGSIKKVA